MRQLNYLWSKRFKQRDHSFLRGWGWGQHLPITEGGGRSKGWSIWVREGGGGMVELEREIDGLIYPFLKFYDLLISYSKKKLLHISWDDFLWSVVLGWVLLTLRWKRYFLWNFGGSVRSPTRSTLWLRFWGFLQGRYIVSLEDGVAPRRGVLPCILLNQKETHSVQYVFYFYI